MKILVNIRSYIFIGSSAGSGWSGNYRFSQRVGIISCVEVTIGLKEVPGLRPEIETELKPGVDVVLIPDVG